MIPQNLESQLAQEKIDSEQLQRHLEDSHQQSDQELTELRKTHRTNKERLTKAEDEVAHLFWCSKYTVYM